MKRPIILYFFILISIHFHSQPSEWNASKTGVWRFENYLLEKETKLRNVTLNTTDNITFKKNITTLAEWFHQNHPMLKNPKGYDLRALTTYIWNDYTTKTEFEYAIPASMGFLFEMFDSKGGKWDIEPPQINFKINDVSGGIAGLYFTPESIVDDGSRYDVSLSKKVDKALENLRQYFQIFPLKAQPFAGVDIYEAYRDGWQQDGHQTIVVYNPTRPAYWLPVTVQEMAEAHLAYYSLFTKTELDRMVYEELQKEIASLSEEELASPAYFGHVENFVLRVNGKGVGLQIMRFNPAYWNKSLPITDIQFLSFYSMNLTQKEMDEQEQRSYPAYPQMFLNQMDWEGVAKLIQKK